jgi:hypothetical protein
MTTNIHSGLRELSDSEVLAHTRDAVRDERVATARVIALLMELDTRRLYLGEGCSSLFTYCTQVLHLSEHAAYNRIETARAARRFPAILELIELGAVTLTTVRLLAPHLTEANHRDLLERARHKTKRNVELLVATISPQPDVPSTVRRLPALVASPSLSSRREEPAIPDVSASRATRPCVPLTPSPAEVKPIASERYKIQFTVSRETHDKLRRAQDLLRHALPNGDPAIVFERALTVLLEQLDRSRTGKTAHPRASRGVNEESRHIPAAVKRTVWKRDNGRCAFNGPHGRCTETGFLEYHHVVPFADGGETSLRNLELRCRAHNQYEADLWFGTPQNPHAREERAFFGWVVE